jgi:hypothetical protein
MTERWLCLNGEAAGPFSEMAILRMVAKGDADADTLFYHEVSEEWRPLTHFRDDFHAEEIARLRREGFRRVEFVAGRTEEECPICQALHGQRFTLGGQPPIPPDECTCNPWSLAHYTGCH